MRSIRYATAFLVFAAAAPLMAAWSQIEVTTFGRRIQLDGFLMEWKQAEARAFPGDSSVTFDVMNTPEGLAGYVHAHGSDSCRLQSVRIFPQLSDMNRFLDMRLDGDSVGSDHYKLGRPDPEFGGGAIVEFVVPWKDLLADSTATTFLAGIVGFSSCADTLGPVTIQGSREQLSATVFTPRVKVQIVVIAVLLVVYLALYSRVRKRNRRTGSPRR